MQKIDPFVQKNLRWNFSVNVMDNMLFVLAVSFISRETVMPLLVSHLTDSKILIGFIPAIYSISYYLPQLFVANRAESMKRKLPFVLLGSGMIQRIPYLLAGIAILVFAQDSPMIALILFFFLIGIGAFGGGVVTPAWFSMIGKIIPVHRRGIFWGLSDGLGMMMGFVGAFFVGITLDVVAYPLNFATLFLIASIVMVFSWVALALTREPESPIIKQQIPLRNYFKQLPVILRENHNYRRFMISYSINRLSMMAVSFFIVYGNERFNLSGADVGMLTAVLIGSQAVMQLALGWLGDRKGHKLNLSFSAFAIALAAILAIGATDLTSLIPAFMLLGAAIASDGISKFNIILEFAVPEDQPTFIGLTNTLIAPITFLGPILGGVIATTFNFQGMFVVSMLCGAVGGLLMLFWVKEPRQIQPQPISNEE
jgi:MFS family permease